VFKLTLLPGSDKYEFTLYKPIDGGFTPVNLNDHIGNNGGNDTWLGYTQLAGDGDILFSGFTHNGSFGALAQGTVNYSQAQSNLSLGVSTGQNIESHELLRIDFPTDLVVGPGGNTA